MFEVSKCSQCGKAVTPENRSEFTEHNGVFICSDCVSGEEQPCSGMESFFESLRNTSFIQNRGDRKYAKASSLHEMIDVFESVHTGRSKWLPGLFLLIVVGGAAAVWLICFSSAFSDPGNTENVTGNSGSSDEKNGKGTGGSSQGNEQDNSTNPLQNQNGTGKSDEADSILQTLTSAYSELKDPFAVRDKAAAAAAQYSHDGLKEFLAQLEEDIAGRARTELKRLKPLIEKTAADTDFVRALSMIREFERKYSDSQWYREQGGDKRIAAIEDTVKKKRTAFTSGLVRMAGTFADRKEYVKAYNTYETILSVCAPEKKEEIIGLRDRLVSEANTFFGEKGLKAHLKWQRYIEFRKEYLMYIKMRDFKTLTSVADEYLKSPEYKLIHTMIQKDVEDLSFVRGVIDQAAEHFGKYIGKQYTLHTDDGTIECIIRKVENGNITVRTSNVDISIPVSELHTEDLFAGSGSAGKSTSLHIGMGILYLAAGNVDKAHIQFGKAKASGADITRFNDHIRAYQNGREEKDAQRDFEHLEKLCRFKRWDALIQGISAFKKKHSCTRFFNGHMHELSTLLQTARARRETCLTLSRHFSPDPSYTGCRDTTLRSETAHARRRNYGRSEYLYASGNDRNHALISFSLSMIPPQADIFEALLSLYCHEIKEPSGDVKVRLYRVAETWEEGRQKQAQPVDGATWFEPVFTDGTGTKKGNWKVYGGTVDTQSDYGYGPNGIIAEHPLVCGEFLEFDVTNIVRTWVSGAEVNNGVMIRVEPKIRGAENCACFCSSEYSSDYSKHPRLFIRFRSHCDEDLSAMSIRRFDGYPGREGTLEFTGKTSDEVISTVLIRESSPERAQRRSNWRGRVGYVNSTRNRVLLSLAPLWSKIPRGAGIQRAELTFFITRSMAEKGEGILDVWQIRDQWDTSEANWRERTDGIPWDTPGCGGRKDRLKKAVSVPIRAGSGFEQKIDITAAVHAGFQENGACSGFLLCMRDEYGSSISFIPENSRSIPRRPSVRLDYFQPEVGNFVPLFTMARRDEWKYASLEKCEFRGRTVHLIPGGSLVTPWQKKKEFVISGEVRKYRGRGPAVIGIGYGKKEIYRALFGERCGLVYRRAGTDISRKLWVSKNRIDLSEWTPVSISVKQDTMFVRVGSLCSGPVKGIDLASGCSISIAAEDCFAGFRGLTAGRKIQ